MVRVTMMDSSTPCCKKPPPLLTERGQQRRRLSVALLAVCLPLASALAPCTAQAQAAVENSTAALPAMQLLRDGEDLLLTADLQWQLPEMVFDALIQGIPVHFVADVEMRRERWYWSDQILLKAQRYLRLSYQPLTRRWRLYIGNQPFEGQGLGLALTKTYENLQEALYAMQRLVRWRIGPVAELPSQGSALLALRFRMDTSQFPRPLQIGALGQADWNLLVTRQERILLDSL
ncbi:MAG: DUF4390 domain-containing protein [Comamonas sp.]|nr:DUF4390 domain-containing protein [Candidatus Comamonas equi]